MPRGAPEGGLFGGVWGGPEKEGKMPFPVLFVGFVFIVFTNPTMGGRGAKIGPAGPIPPREGQGRVGMGDFRAQ